MKKILLQIILGIFFIDAIYSEIPQGGNNAISNLSGDFSFHPNDKINAEIIRDGIENEPVFKIKTIQRQDNFWNVQLSTKTIIDIQKGDTLLAAFSAKTINSKNNISSLHIYFQRNSPPWDKSITIELSFGKEWTDFLVPFSAHNSFKAGEAGLYFGLGLNEQEIQIKNIRLINYGKSKQAEQLPKTPIDESLYAYQGMEEDAPWRKAASERIEKIRKSDIKILALKDGKPLQNAKIKVEMKKHAFPFGSAYAFWLIRSDSQDGRKYREKILELFNSGSNENALKWPPLAGDWGHGWTFAEAEKSLQWLKNNNIKTRGHVLVWPGWHNSPKYLRQFENEPEKLKAEIEKHIIDLTQKSKDYINEWDVINEPYDNNDLLKILGYEIMAEWFKIARQSLPEGKLYLNDYDILSAPRGKHYEFFKKTVQDLLHAGAPINGLGLQCHFGNYLHPPEEVFNDLEDLAKFGLEMKVTEFDITHSAPSIAAKYKRDFMTVVFSHPSVCGFQLWGFWAGAHWRPEAAMFKKDWSETPLLHVYKDLVFREWWTNTEGYTDEHGLFSTRAFLGDYEVSAEVNKLRKSQKIKLEKNGINLKFEF